MGEIAEMMLDGTMCSSCGDYLDTDAGYPILCDDCQSTEDGAADPEPQKSPSHSCGSCGKKFRTAAALKQHVRDKHGIHANKREREKP